MADSVHVTAEDSPASHGVSRTEISSEPTSPVKPDPAQKTKHKSALREIIETALLALLIFLLVRMFVLNFKVDGTSMNPTFHNGEMLLVNRNAYRELSLWDLVDWIPGIGERNDSLVLVDWGDPERGDVIVFTPPAPGEDKPYIKRVIGVPGDVVEVKVGGVYVNGKKLDESYIQGRNVCQGTYDHCGPITVGDDQVFVMGDNRGNSSDSRYFGVVDQTRIIGKAWITYWPQSDWGIVPHRNYPELDK